MVGSNDLRSSRKRGLKKQQSTVGKFLSRPLTKSVVLEPDALAAQFEVEVFVALADGKKKPVAVKCLDSTTVREVLELLVQKMSSSKTKKFLAAKNVGSVEALGLMVPSEPVVWLRPTAPIGRYCDLDGAPPPLLVADATPLAGLPPGQLTVRITLEDGLNARFLELDETRTVQEQTARCAQLLAVEGTAAPSVADMATWQLFCWKNGKGFWLDGAAVLGDYMLPLCSLLELREPNFVVLTTVAGSRILLDGLSTGESFLRLQLQRLKIPSNSSCYYSLFKEAGEGQLVELPTWQTVAKMGLVEGLIVHVGKVEDADMPPTSLQPFWVASVALRGASDEHSVAMVAGDAAAAAAAEEGPELAAGAGQPQRDQRDWHSLMKLYVHEDILARVEGVELLGGTVGNMCMTNGGLVFKSDKSYVRIFHGMIAKVEKVPARQKKKKAGSAAGGAGATAAGPSLLNLDMLKIECKDFETICFVLPKNTPKNFWETLLMLAFPRESRQLYAFSYQLPSSVAPNPQLPDGWRLYDPVAYHERMGVGTPGSEWALSDVNAGYALCDTYPALLAFPLRCSHDALRSSASFRSRGRLPALSYLHRNGASVTRCSQPKVGLIGGSSGGDQVLLQAILEGNPNKEQPVLRLIDARPKLNAIANQAMGKGSERVFHYDFDCTLEFANIDNIHVMRQSLVKLHEACRASKAGELDFAAWQNQLSSSGWLSHVHKVLSAGVKVARYVGIERQSVVLHCLALDQEILTSQGFLGFAELARRWDGHKLSRGLLIGTMNADTRALEFQAAEELICNDANESDGWLIEFCRADVGLCLRVTPGHTMYCRSDSAWQKMTAGQLMDAMQANAEFAVWSLGNLMDGCFCETVALGRAHVRRVRYARETWCVRVPNGLIVARTEETRVAAASLPVVVGNCSDGWDRTAQLSSLSMLLLNPFFRTLRGFCELVEKEWLAFGHQFARRHGHADGKMEQDGDSQRSPVFLQFLDCAWQLCNIYPVAFEYTGYFLATVIEEVYNCRFGTFLFDSERERAVAARGATVSLWTYILSPSVVDLYRNPLYKATPDALLHELQPHAISLWAEYHCHTGRTRDDHERVREMSMRIETLEAQLAALKKRAAAQQK